MDPVISIIIPCYNHGQYIMDAISSVEQYPDKSVYEIIIINDGSTDENTIAVLKSLEVKGYHVINQNNQGLSMARNNGISIAKGKYILPLDADNKIKPAYIQKGISVLDADPKIGIVYGNSLFFGEENRINRVGKFSLRKLLIDNYIDACVVMRKEVWTKAGGYDANISPLADWDMNLCTIENGWELFYIPEIMFEYRVRKDSMIKTFADKEKCITHIANKHGVLYRAGFLESVTIKSRAKFLLKDIWQKLTGRPNY